MHQPIYIKEIMKYWERRQNALFLTQETIVLEEKTRIQDWSQSEQELSLCARQHLHLSIILSLPTHHPFDLSRLYPFAGCLYFLRRPQTLCTVVNIIVLHMMEAFRQICFLVPSVGLDTCACTQRWDLSKLLNSHLSFLLVFIMLMLDAPANLHQRNHEILGATPECLVSYTRNYCSGGEDKNSRLKSKWARTKSLRTSASSSFHHSLVTHPPPFWSEPALSIRRLLVLSSETSDALHCC